MGNGAYSKETAEAIRNFLDDIEVTYSFDEYLEGRDGVFNFGIGLDKSKMKSIKCIIDVSDNSFVVYGYSPIKADIDDKDRMLALAEFICRANFGLNAGNFELDMDGGDLRFKYYVNCINSVPGKGVLMESLFCPMAMFDRYGDGILNMIFSGADPKEEVKNAEVKNARQKDIQ